MIWNQALGWGLGVAMGIALLAGCGGGDGDDGPALLDLAGSWSGRYVSPSLNRNVNATITQDRDVLTIETTLEGVGHSFAGTIDTNNQIAVTDNYDGETWTSYGPVSTNAFLIRDFLYDPVEGTNSPDQGIYFNR